MVDRRLRRIAAAVVLLAAWWLILLVLNLSNLPDGADRVRTSAG